MKYTRSTWRHDDPSKPVSIYAELNDAGQEIRKVYVFAGGRLACATETKSTKDIDIRLSDQLLDFKKAAAYCARPESTLAFEPIDEATFTEMWQKATV
jgi:hypothetical protein